MAHTATNTSFADTKSVLSRLFASLKAVAVTYVEARSRQAEISALEALSDEELAKRGIRREDIVRHVFADCVYL